MKPTTIPAPLHPSPLRQPSYPLPPYRYVPGVQPHPWRSTEGHHHQDGLPKQVPLWQPGQEWQNHSGFLHGCDLFDRRYFWEAHEMWEEIWHAVPREHTDRALLQLLIQSAACCLKVHMRQAASAQKLLERCRFRRGLCSTVVVDLDGLMADLTAFVDGGDWPLLRFAKG